MSKLFEVAILEHPTKDDADKGATSKLVFGPKCVVARDEQGALVAALMDGERPPALDMQRAQVLIRPFASDPSQKPQGAGVADLILDSMRGRRPKVAREDLICTSSAPAWLTAVTTSHSGPPYDPVANTSFVNYGKAPKGHSYTGATLSALNLGATHN